MEKRTTVLLGLLAVATAALGTYFLLSRRARRSVVGAPWHPTGALPTDDDDPFADMIEEGAGLLGQMKAEAEELARKAGLI